MQAAARLVMETRATVAAIAREAEYFESAMKGLGQRFTNEIEAATWIAAEFPQIGSPFKFGTRRVFPKKFPWVRRVAGLLH